MAQFVVDSDLISSRSAEARGFIDRLTAEVNGMTSALNSLEESWTGSASASFQSVLARWRSTQAQVEASVAEINEALALAGNQYSETEAANTRMFS